MSNICIFCKKSIYELQVCYKCKKYIYCSKECQNKDWDNHKLICIEYMDNINSDIIIDPINKCGFI
jgi:hypothetical protein